MPQVGEYVNYFLAERGLAGSGGGRYDKKYSFALHLLTSGFS
jgi:hypothetical protein